MTKWDSEYIKLCKKILYEGVEVENRTGTNSIKIPSYHLHFDLREEFPVLATKQLYFRQAITEMLFFIFFAFILNNFLSLTFSGDTYYL